MGQRGESVYRIPFGRVAPAAAALVLLAPLLVGSTAQASPGLPSVREDLVLALVVEPPPAPAVAPSVPPPGTEPLELLVVRKPHDLPVGRQDEGRLDVPRPGPGDRTWGAETKRVEATWSGQVGVDAGSVWNVEGGWLGSLHTRGSLTLRDRGSWKLDVAGSFRVREGGTGPLTEGTNSSWKDLEVEEGHQGLSSISVSRTHDGLGSLRAGRYVPEELPALGQIDAVGAELHPSDALRAGLVLGLRPRPDDRDAAADRPVAATYVGTQIRAREAFRYSGTLGLLVTGYDGSPDRFACLLSQRADVGAGLTLHSGTELDLHGAVADGRTDDVQLSSQRLEAVSSICRLLTLRVGLDHRKTPDTREERAAAPDASEERYREGGWRRWVGGSHALPWNLRLDEEVCMREEVGQEKRTGDWQLSIRRSGLPGIPGAAVGMCFRSIEGLDSGRVGCRVSGDFRLLESRLSLRPSIALEMGGPEGERERARVSDLSLQARWDVREGLQLFASACHSFDSAEERPFLEVGVEWWF